MSFIPGMPFVGGAPSRYRINQSLRFRANNSAFLSYTEKAGTSRRVQTFNFKHKRARLGYASGESLFFTRDTGASPFTYDDIRFDTNDRLVLYGYIDNSTRVYDLRSTWRFRDPTAWLNITVVFDTTQATAANRVRAWVGNEEITSWEVANFPAQNTDLQFGAAGNVSYIGRSENAAVATDYSDMYLADVVRVDGQALTPASFGQTDPATGLWVPRRYTGTYGTNGFYLPFNDATSTTTISQDRSGNGNNWTSSGISVTAGATFDQMLDSPTSNSVTLSPLAFAGTGASTLNANSRLSVTTAGGNIKPTFGINSNVGYAEFYIDNIGGATGTNFAIALSASDTSSVSRYMSCEYYVNGQTYNYNTASFVAYGATYTTGDWIGVKWDCNAQTVEFFKNNVSQGVLSAPSVAVNTAGAPVAPIPTSSGSASTVTVDCNWGGRPYQYSIPSGAARLNTANLSTPTIQNGASAFQATLRTGTGASASVSSLAFQPDLVWIKSRSNASNHNLFDAVRGVNNGLVSNSTAVEYADANSLTAFNSNGYSLGTDGSSRGVNINTNTYVDWAWREGAAYGFDIVTFTKTTSVQNVTHNLNAVPHMMVVKQRGASGSWVVYHRNMTASPQGQAMFLDLTSATAAYPNLWNGTAPTSSQFTVGSDYPNAPSTYVAYLWTSIPGFSLFGSYTGNGSADGPFVWCGFRPRWVMIKRVDTGGFAWCINDAARDPANVLGEFLYPNTSAAGSTFSALDFTANGFKLRWSDNSQNASGGTYIFAAFAETPFKTATAR